MGADKNTSQVVFFLGAGASVNAGVPDTYAFVNEFINSIPVNPYRKNIEPQKKTTIKKIVQILKEWKGTEIDIELLLETLTKLENKEQEPLLRFFEGGDFILKGYSEKKPLIDDLKDFIKSKTIVSEEKIKYLLPFLWFIEEFRPFDIISLNYDTCIEQFCNVHKLTYQDGFDVHWNPKSFATENTDVRLYKLHGSVMWYQSDRGGYIKLPVMTKASKIQLITGEKAENLMLYPMQKWDYAEPLLELLVEVKRLLESNTCKFLVVIGYSFRDDHIRKILWDAGRKNKALHLILVDPKAYEIYHKKLKYYDAEQKIPSSLVERVVCLPYKFEKVFKWLKNYHLKYLQEALKADTDERQRRIRGERTNWLTILKLYVNAGHTERAESIWERVDNPEFEADWQASLELPLKMWLSFSANGQIEKAEEYLIKFKNQLYLMFVERLNINVILEPQIIEINFNYHRTDSGSGCVPAEMMKAFIESLSQQIENQNKIICSKNKKADNIKGTVDGIRNYLKAFIKGRINFDRYIQLWKDKMDAVTINLLEMAQEKSGKISQDSCNKLIENILQIEKKILEEIINIMK
jgi:hypothetical protein